MKVRTLSKALAVLDTNVLVDTLTERLSEVEVNLQGDIFSKVEGDALVETLSE